MSFSLGIVFSPLVHHRKVVSIKEPQYFPGEEVKEWSASEFFEMRERFMKIVLILLGLIAWGVSFRFWESTRLRDAWFPFALVLCLVFTWLLYERKGLDPAARVCIPGTLISVFVEMVLFPGSWVWILLVLPILQAGILVGSRVAVAVGMLETLFLVGLNFFLQSRIPLNPVLFYLLSTTVLVWYTAHLIQTSLYQTVFYALKNRDALEEARDHQGRLVRAIKSMEESNARLVKAYDNIALLQHEADQERKRKVQFANMLSHEMRAPLNFIIGATELMVNSPKIYRNGSWPSGLQEDIRRVYQSSQHLQNLINDVLALGQAEAHRMVFMFAEISLNEVFDEVVSILGAMFENNRLYLDIKVDPDVPPLKVDRIRIRQVILNLISNSLRHTKKGGVKVFARRDGENIIVSVEDTGTGIPPENLANLFQEFYQSEPLNDNFLLNSSGLGLAISKQYVELHGGSIWGESPIQQPRDGEGPGSRFSFSLPASGVSPLQSLSVGQNNAYFQRKERTVQAKQNTILIYEPADSGLVSQLPIAISGYQLAHCSSEESLMVALEQYHPSGVILVNEEGGQPSDIDLPNNVLSIQCQIQSETLDLTEMWDGYLTKPSTPDQLLEAINAAGIRPRTCLVIDDDPDISRFVELSFLSIGINTEIRYAGTGQKGLSLIQSYLPDITLLDINLPDMSGWNILEQIRAMPATSDLPVIIFSAIDHPKPIVIKLKSLRVLNSSSLNISNLNDVLQGIFNSMAAGD